MSSVANKNPIFSYRELTIRLVPTRNLYFDQEKKHTKTTEKAEKDANEIFVLEPVVKK